MGRWRDFATIVVDYRQYKADNQRKIVHRIYKPKMEFALYLFHLKNGTFLLNHWRIKKNDLSLRYNNKDLFVGQINSEL